MSEEEALQKFCQTVRTMNSSAMLDQQEKDLCSYVLGAVDRSMHDEAFIQTVCELEKMLVENHWFHFHVGGILSAVYDLNVQQSWKNLWEILTLETSDMARHDPKKALRSYLMALATKLPKDVIPNVVPNLSDMPEWHIPIDDALYQRYDNQVGFILTNVRKRIKISKNASLAALAAISSIATNVNSNGMYQFHIEKNLYKVPLAIDLKARAYFNVSDGDAAAVVLKNHLLHDGDLRNEVVNILRDSSSLHVSSETCECLFKLIIEACICSVLKSCLSNAGILSSQQVSTAVPLRTKLNLIGKKK